MTVNAIIPLNIAALRVSANDDFQVTPSMKGRMAQFDASNPSTGDRLLSALDQQSSPTAKLELGVHLHWELPDAFRRGRQSSDDGAVVFPQAPNRWLVTRYLRGARDGNPTGPLRTARWIVESDALIEEPQRDRYGVLRPAVPVPLPSADGSSRHCFMGRVVEYGEWLQGADRVSHLGDHRGPDGAPLRLTSTAFVGPGFSSYYPECRSVFGFWDTFADAEDPATGKSLREQLSTNAAVDFVVSYQVIGWIDDPAADPLAGLAQDAAQRYGERVQQCRFHNVPLDLTPAEAVTGLLEARHGWRLPADSIGSVCDGSGALISLDAPTGTLCAGHIQDVVWDNRDPARTFFLRNTSGADAAEAGATWDDKVTVTVGNTLVEALSVLLTTEMGGSTSGDAEPAADVADDDELLLDALQLGLLYGLEHKRNRIVELEDALHTRGFARKAGGLLWAVRREEDAGDRGGEGQVTLPASLAEQLYVLNAAQKRYDQARARLHAMRDQLFMDWFRYIRLLLGDDTDPNVDTGYLFSFVWNAVQTVRQEGTATGRLIVLLDPDTQEVTGVQAALDDSSLAASVGRAHASACETLAGSDGLALQAVPAPPFWTPNEPVLVVEGDRIEPVRRNGTQDTTAIRTSGDLLDRLTVRVGDTLLTVTAADLQDVPPLDDRLPKAADLRVLAAESWLLVPELADGVADAVAAKGGVGNPALTDRAGFISFLRQAKTPCERRADPASADAVTLTNARGGGRAPDPLSRSAQRPLPEFSVTRLDPFMPVFAVWDVELDPLRPLGDTRDYSSDNLTASFGLDDDRVEYTCAPVPGLTTGDPVRYRGTTLLAQRPASNLLAQIDRYITDHPDDRANDELAKLRASYTGRRILGLALGDFGLQQTLRTAIPQLVVGDDDPTKRPADLATPLLVRATTEQSHDNWYDEGFASVAPIPSGPLAQCNFGPLRAGWLEVKDLQVVDVFGQIMRLHTTPGLVTAVPSRALRMSVNGPPDAGRTFLPPRLLVPTRAWFRWLSASHSESSTEDPVETNAHPATSPVFGWVMPNHLDDTLAFHDGAGKPIGMFGVEHGTLTYRSHPESGAGTADDLSADIGPAGTPAPGTNPHLAAFMWELHGRGSGFFGDLMAAVLASDAAMRPSDAEQGSALAVLIGRPLALTRAVVGLETQGGVLPVSQASTSPGDPFPQDVTQPGWDLTERMTSSSAGLAEVRFPLRLGDVANLDDGLVGYVVQQPQQAPVGDFISAYGPRDNGNGVVRPRAESLTAALNERPDTVVMLLDPRSPVHLTSAILPVESLRIPPDHYAGAMSALSVAFVARPLLRAADGLTVPLPQEAGFEWSFIGVDPATGLQAEQPLRANAVDGQARAGYSPQTVSEGWARLRPNQTH